MKIIKYKKAEMTSKQLVTIILLLTGFVILMMIFPTAIDTSDIDREVCHQSVVIRMTLPDIGDIKNLPPLKCKTEKICITDKTFGKGDCKSDLGDNYNSIKISKDNEKRETEINKIIADELVACWAMMGEGKAQIFTSNLMTDKACSVCTRIAFDESLKKELNEVNGLGDYLVSKNVPNSNENVWKFLTNQNTLENSDSDLGSFSTKQKAIVFIEINPGTWLSWAGATHFGSAALAVAIASGPIGWVSGAVLVVGGATIGWVSGEKISGAFNPEYYSGWVFVDYDEKDIKGLECSSFESIS